MLTEPSCKDKDNCRLVGMLRDETEEKDKRITELEEQNKQQSYLLCGMNVEGLSVSASDAIRNAVMGCIFGGGHVPAGWTSE